MYELQNVLLQNSCHNHFTFNTIEKCKFVKSGFNFTLSTVISGLKCGSYLIRLLLTFNPQNTFTAKYYYKLVKLLTLSKDKTIKNNMSFIDNSIEKTESKYSICLWQFKQKPILYAVKYLQVYKSPNALYKIIHQYVSGLGCAGDSRNSASCNVHRENPLHMPPSLTLCLS